MDRQEAIGLVIERALWHGKFDVACDILKTGEPTPIHYDRVVGALLDQGTYTDLDWKNILGAARMGASEGMRERVAWGYLNNHDVITHGFIDFAKALAVPSIIRAVVGACIGQSLFMRAYELIESFDIELLPEQFERLYEGLFREEKLSEAIELAKRFHRELTPTDADRIVRCYLRLGCLGAAVEAIKYGATAAAIDDILSHMGKRIPLQRRAMLSVLQRGASEACIRAFVEATTCDGNIELAIQAAMLLPSEQPQTPSE